MKKLISFIFAGMLSTSAFAAATIVPTDNAICTRDYNMWGHAGSCACPESTYYDQRIKQCLQGELEPIAAQGEIITPVAAIGGETTGVVLQQSEDENYELVLPLYLKAALAEAEANGTQYQIEGDFINLPGVEIESRPTIIVESLTPLNP